MKHPTRLAAAALVVAVALGILGVSVETQDRGRGGPVHFTADGVRQLREWDRTIERMERNGELLIRRTQFDSMVTGHRFERLEQRYRGLAVWGGEVVRETDGQVTLSLTASLYSDIHIDSTPELSPAQAAAIFGREVERANVSELRPELLVYPRADGSFALAYRVSQFASGHLPVLFINAKDGHVENRYDNLQTQEPAIVQGKGVFGDDKKVSASAQSGGYLAWDRKRPTAVYTLDLKGNPWRVLDIQNPGALPVYTTDVAFVANDLWTDAAVVDAHVYAGWTYDFFFKRFAWKGLDNNNGRGIYVIVHPIARNDLAYWLRTAYWPLMADFYVNSSFCPRCGYRGIDLLTLGEGLPSGVTYGGQIVDYAAASIDTVSHEYAHGVTSYSSNLIYQNESGALNEAFSDIMADSVEWFFQQPGTGLMKADYIHGEDSHRPSGPGSGWGIRSLADPSAYDCSVDRAMRCPDHYSLRYAGREDGGGVHVNSSIVNHAFYLAIEGGANRTSGLSVQGVGATNREQIERAFFRALTALPSNATFTLARARTIDSARVLYGAGSPAERAITQAWSAVGVF